MPQDITLTVDYHDRACVVRRFDQATRREQVLTEVPTNGLDLLELVQRTRLDAGPEGRITWIQESTTGWARVKDLLGERVDFRLANVLQMPRPPKARRRKTDKLDTARLQREHLAGNLPLAHQPAAELRQLRRLVAYREDLVNRRTALRNWINRYLAHETWVDRTGLWSPKGRERLRGARPSWPRTDALVIGQKLEELDRIEEQLNLVIGELLIVYGSCPEARRVDAIRGIGVVAAVSIVARIGPVQRFRDAEALIGFAGLAPGVQESDRSRRDGPIGGGGTDTRLRHYLIEATVWARELPRYRPTYERIRRRRGSKVGRLVVARMLLRSLYKVLKEGVDFDGGAATPPEEVAASP
jgi:transposase